MNISTYISILEENMVDYLNNCSKYPDKREEKLYKLPDVYGDDFFRQLFYTTRHSII